MGVEIDPATVSVLLAEVPRSVVASPELLARYPAVKTPEDLQQLPWIAISSFYQRHVELFHDASSAPARVTITPRLSTDSLYVARNTALTGLGVAVVSSWTVQDSGADAEDNAGGHRNEKAPATAIKKPTRRSAFSLSVRYSTG